MNFLLSVIGNLGAAVLKLLPLFFAYRAGAKAKEHDFEKSLNEVLNEDNQKLRADAAMPDAAIADKLRDRAKRKRKDQD